MDCWRNKARRQDFSVMVMALYRGRLRKRTTKHANGWRVRLNPKKLRRKRQTRQETALI